MDKKIFKELNKHIYEFNKQMGLRDSVIKMGFDLYVEIRKLPCPECVVEFTVSSYIVKYRGIKIEFNADMKPYDYEISIESED